MDSDESSISDMELQKSFASGELKPGINILKKPERNWINNVHLLNEKLKEMNLSLNWIEFLDITVTVEELQKQIKKKKENEYSKDKMNHSYLLPDMCSSVNDLKLENLFYYQAQNSVSEVIKRLHKHKISTKRPKDYFAEMVKSDEHMEKIRQMALSRKIIQERSEKAKQIRLLKKQKKKMQIEALYQKQNEKKKLANQIKLYSHKKIDSLDFLEVKAEKKNTKTLIKSKEVKRKMLKKRYKDKKFGFGGQKKRSKYNTAQSTANLASDKFFQKKKLRSMKKIRPGKSKRIKKSKKK